MARPTKRRRTNGSVRFHKTWKLYEYRYYVGGTRKTGYAKTKAEAENKLNRALILVADGRISGDNPRFKDYAEIWLENHKALGRVREETSNQYRRLLAHAFKQFGNVKMQDIKASHLENLYRSRLKVNSPTTVNDIHRVIATMWKQAMRSGIVVIDVPSNVQPPSRNKRLPYIMNESQRIAFIKACKEETRVLEGLYFEFLFLTGMRAEVEALAIKWNDVNFKEGFVTVLKSKTDSGIGRKVYIQRDLLARLKEQHDLLQLRREHSDNKYNPNDYVFCNNQGNQHDLRNLRSRNWKRIKEKVNLSKDFRIHDLRHNFVSLMLQLGHPIPDVQKMVGHANASITMKIYSHSIPQNKEVVLDVLDKLIPTEVN